jgi:hypothetical protein
MQNDIHKLEELFVTYEQALFLKELDYNEPCFEYFDSKSKLTFNTNGNPISKDWVWFGNQCLPIDMTLAPLKDQVFKFFREKHNLVGIVKFGANDFTYYIYNGDAVGVVCKRVFKL